MVGTQRDGLDTTSELSLEIFDRLEGGVDFTHCYYLLLAGHKEDLLAIAAKHIDNSLVKVVGCNTFECCQVPDAEQPILSDFIEGVLIITEEHPFSGIQIVKGKACNYSVLRKPCLDRIKC